MPVFGILHGQPIAGTIVSTYHPSLIATHVSCCSKRTKSDERQYSHLPTHQRRIGNAKGMKFMHQLPLRSPGPKRLAAACRPRKLRSLHSLARVVSCIQMPPLMGRRDRPRVKKGCEPQHSETRTFPNYLTPFHVSDYTCRTRKVGICQSCLQKKTRNLGDSS